MRRRVLLVLAATLAATGTTATALQGQQAVGPAPTEDRVGFPEDYEASYAPLYTFDRPDNRSVRVVYGNQAAASTRAGEPFPYGSTLVMEVYRALLDDGEDPTFDTNGRFQRGQMTGIFVMRKEQGFGEAYGPIRNGEWEYVAFRPDRSYLSAPSQTSGCAACHLDAGGTRDWVWRANLYFNHESGALPSAPPGLESTGRAYMQHYLFLPESNTVRAGSTVTWSNDDSAVHTVTALDGSFDSGKLAPGATFSATFAEPGEYLYYCSIHVATPSESFFEQEGRMDGKIIVQP